jgi:hypothetical protein
MSIKSVKKMKKLATAVCTMAFVFFAFFYGQEVANAQSNSVPTSIVSRSDYYTTSQHTKAFTLDGLAWQAAKILVQQITASTVKWINSGFQGSPAFLTNPEGYFANIGDQVTGAFISDTGILSGLCSPFSVDLRLALALGQVNGNNRPYTCTLSSVINNTLNSKINGMSIGGFMNGDFSQGGWSAFISLSEPQNNEAGAYLQAHSDLLQRIGAKQSTVNQQLNQGGGFLSWQSCNDVVGSLPQAVPNVANNVSSSLNGTQSFSSDYSSNMYVNNASAVAQANPSGNIDPKNGMLQTCQTETPGSVINAQLNHVLPSGIDQLNLANSINQVISALMSQLVTQVLQGGLAHSSQTSSGVTQSYIDQLSAEANGTSQFTSSSNSIQGAFSQYINESNQTAAIYGQIVSSFQTIGAELSSATACFNGVSTAAATTTTTGTLGTLLGILINLIAQGTNPVPNYLSDISATSTKMYAIEAGYQTKLDQASTTATLVSSQATSTANVSTVNDLQNSSDALQSFISTEVPVIQQNLTTAQADQTTAQTQAQQFDTIAKGYISKCTSLGGTIPATASTTP